ncbi:MAG: folate-binding protein YgfZ [Hyphomicrobiales bacterium]|nr:folate-binding protein YgfZ [Hyphomicrobiales bacterium]
MQAAHLPDRGIVKVAGSDSRKLLERLLTVDIDAVAAARARYAALLTPQGKIIVDFMIARPANDHYLLDCPRALAPTLVDKLNAYKLRAKVLIEDLSRTCAVLATWDGVAGNGPGAAYDDPRLPALGQRRVIATDLAPMPLQTDLALLRETASQLGAELVDADAYERHRIALAIPRGGIDFIYGDAFPHEADMDQLGGVDFDKGCFVGQEVVSRMEHRGTARTRVVPVAFDGPSPEAGLPVTADRTTLGTMGSGSGAIGRGLALLRLDRLAEAMANATPITAGGIAIRPFKPAWARFPWPAQPRAAE